LELHFDGALVDEPTATLDERRLVRLEQSADATRHLLDDAALPVLHLVRVDVDATDRDARIRHVLRLLEEVSVGDQRLRRDAAPVDAHAADLFLLDASNGEAELTGTNGTGITARAAPEDQDVVGRFHGAPSTLALGASQDPFEASNTVCRF